VISPHAHGTMSENVPIFLSYADADEEWAAR
jgi:hypothetical protein